MSKAQRYDFGKIRTKPRKNKSGFLRLSASLTRTGVLVYERADGTKIRELRHPKEVFSEKSLASLENVPFTDSHPSEMVNADNFSKYQKGFVVAGSVREDAGRFVVGDVLVQDKELVDLILEKKRGEVSPGYTCELVFEPGTYQGEKYDARQTNIEYNHVAVGEPENWGRSGPEVRVHLDSGQDVAHEYRVDAPQEISPAPKAGKKEKKTKKMTIKIDGINYEAEESTAQAVEKKLAELTKELEIGRARLDAAADEVTKAQAELEASKVELEKATNLDTIRAIAKTRLELEDKAEKLGAEAKFDGLTDHEVRVAALAALGVDTSNKSVDYVEARFDHATFEAVKAEEVVVMDTAEADSQSVVEAAVTPIEREDSEDSEIKPGWTMTAAEFQKVNG